MYRTATILLALSFAVLGSGAAAHLHNLDHAARDAAATSHERDHHDCERPHTHEGHEDDHDHEAPAAPGHDESNCDIHAQLQAPVIAGGWVPVPVCLGLFVAFLTLLSPRLTPQRVPPRTDCRGPPAC